MKLKICGFSEGQHFFNLCGLRVCEGEGSAAGFPPSDTSLLFTQLFLRKNELELGLRLKFLKFT